MLRTGGRSRSLWFALGYLPLLGLVVGVEVDAQLSQDALRNTAAEAALCYKLDWSGSQLAGMDRMEKRLWLTLEELAPRSNVAAVPFYVVRPAPGTVASEFPSVRWAVSSMGDTVEIRWNSGLVVITVAFAVEDVAFQDWFDGKIGYYSDLMGDPEFGSVRLMRFFC